MQINPAMNSLLDASIFGHQNAQNHAQEKHHAQNLAQHAGQTTTAAAAAAGLSSVSATPVAATDPAATDSAHFAGTVEVVFSSREGDASASLSGELVASLQQFFGPQDFAPGADGSVTLSGEAERFVSGWHDEIAYTVGMLAALRSGATLSGERTQAGDAQLSDAGILSLRNMYDLRGEQLATHQRLGDIVGERLAASLGPGQNGEIWRTMDGALATFLSMDADRDGRLSLRELLESQLKMAGREVSDEAVGEEFARLSEELEIVHSAAEQINANAWAASTSAAWQDAAARGELRSMDGMPVGGGGGDDEQKKRELKVAEAVAALPKIRAKVAADGAKSLQKRDRDHLNVLQIEPASLERTATQRRNEERADAELVRQIARASGMDERQVKAASTKDFEKLAELAQLSKQLSGELLGRTGIDRLV